MIDKNKILAGVRACINPNISNCQVCPYWENGQKNCEELRMDICEAVITATMVIQEKTTNTIIGELEPPREMWQKRNDDAKIRSKNL